VHRCAYAILSCSRSVSRSSTSGRLRLIGSTPPPCASGHVAFATPRPLRGSHARRSSPCHRFGHSPRLRSCFRVSPENPRATDKPRTPLSRGSLPHRRNPAAQSHRPRAFHLPGHVASSRFLPASTPCSLHRPPRCISTGRALGVLPSELHLTGVASASRRRFPSCDWLPVAATTPCGDKRDRLAVRPHLPFRSGSFVRFGVPNADRRARLTPPAASLQGFPPREPSPSRASRRPRVPDSPSLLPPASRDAFAIGLPAGWSATPPGFPSRRPPRLSWAFPSLRLSPSRASDLPACAVTPRGVARIPTRRPHVPAHAVTHAMRFASSLTRRLRTRCAPASHAVSGVPPCAPGPASRVAPLPARRLRIPRSRRNGPPLVHFEKKPPFRVLFPVLQSVKERGMWACLSRGCRPLRGFRPRPAHFRVTPQATGCRTGC